jgi:segregation and condensation protein A
VTVTADAGLRVSPHAGPRGTAGWTPGTGGGDGGESASFVVELTHFSGPLDLLLTLLHEEQIDICDIPIARVAEQFLARIRTLRLDEAADYLEMAARLLRIKAQMLLPRHDGEEAWDDPRAELVRRLLEYQQVREVVDVLEARAELRRSRFAHPPLPSSERPAVRPPLAAALADVLAAVDRVLRLAHGPIVHAVVPRALDVAGALEAARSLLAHRSRVYWADLVAPTAEAWQILSVLLALLELARLGECMLCQSMPYAPVEIAGATRASLFANDADRTVQPRAPGVRIDDERTADTPSITPDPAHDTAGAVA